jgi:hypothetical protein
MCGVKPKGLSQRAPAFDRSSTIGRICDIHGALATRRQGYALSELDLLAKFRIGGITK